jgi:uncharacterized protein involved in exopolysaccharide biosynthesis
MQNLSESINRDRDRRLILEKAAADALANDNPSLAPDGGGAAAADPAAGSEGRAIEQLDKARNDLQSMELRLKPEHPDIVAKKRQVAELERKVNQESSAERPASAPAAKPVTTAELIRRRRAQQYQPEIDKLDRQIAAKDVEMERLRRSVSDYQHKVDSVPGHESELTDLMRDYETLQKIYSSLLAKKEDSKISANLERQQVSEQFKILDRARIAERPFSPNRLMITAMAAAAGLMVGMAIAGFMEYRTTALRTEDEIVRELVLPVIAAIPIMVTGADIARRRRVMIASVALAVIVLTAMTAVSLLRFGLLKGLR